MKTARKPSLGQENRQLPPDDQSDLSEPSEAPIERKNRLFFILGVFFLVLIFVSTLGTLAYYLNSQSKPTSAEVELIQKPTLEIAEPEPSPILLNKSKWNFEILNGSGVSGAAKQVADKLTTSGYQVVKLGNADKQNYSKNSLFVSEALLSEADLLLADIGSKFQVSTISGTLKTSTPSARLIIGKN